ncbi:MAG TPA: phosphatidate cytidylyltransferase [Caldimonas sp.]|nr:phosphatidate cytidylyltransferase [Caldimonas sp.]
MNALRVLSVSQQVGLLFVVLFGLLGVVTIVAFGKSLREATPEQTAIRERFGRELRALWIAAVVFWIAWVSGPIGSTLLFSLVSFLTLRELVSLTHTRRADHRSLLLAFFVVLPIQYVLVGLRLINAFTVFIPVYVFFAIPVISALANDPHRFLERTAKIQWGVTVTVYGLSHAPALLLLDLPRYRERGAFLVLFLVFVVAAAQIGEEIAARRLRRRPVARAISRSFSWRAFGVGVGGAAAVGLLLDWITPFDPFAAIAMGAIAGAAAMLGQFVMQALKRDAGFRSATGTSSVTGAVGLLDRLAPLCFAAPVFFHAVRGYFGI